MSMFLSDTITAIATPPGRGGIGVVRVSGGLCQEIAQAVLNILPKPRFAYLGAFYDEAGDVIDQGLAIYFPNPNSFTGEDVLELHGHGGPVVMDRLLQRMISLGARLAEPGEFSKRAFLNGKIDLTQAEAIADLIDASSKQAAKLAIKSLQGEFSKQIDQLLKQLIELRVYVEASIDFSEEEIDFLSKGHVKEKIHSLLEQLAQIRRSAQQGVLMREGMTVVIAGKPNVGKSTLLNCLTGRDSAIVTDIAGTTRDVLREYIQIDGMPLHIIDTAGLRDTNDVIEQEGVRRAQKEMELADRVLLITDSDDIDDVIPENIPVTVIRNKIDLNDEKPRVLPYSGKFAQTESQIPIIYLSAKKQQGIDLLEKHLKAVMGFDTTTEGTFIARRRHLEALDQTTQFLQSAQAENEIELLAEELHQAQNYLSEITGEFTTDDLLGEIFSSFCVGK